MSLEDKIVQSLKDETLFKLVGDEDAIATLVKRAIHEALYQPQRIQKQYGGWDDRDSIVVEAARSIAKTATVRVIEQITAEVLADVEIKKLMRNAIADNLPSVIEQSMANSFSIYRVSVSQESMRLLQEAIRNKQV
jgi:hypothetical protein